MADTSPVPDFRDGFTLALGAGGGRGWAHLGVARALDEQGLRPKLIVGASMGAVVGAGLAAGLTPDQISAIANKVNVWQETRRRAHLSHFDVRPLVDKVLAEIGDPRIEDLPIPFGATTLDLTTGREEVIRSGRVADALCRATAIPLVFAPQPEGAAVWVDAGFWEGVPVTASRTLAADQPVIGVEVFGSMYALSSWPIAPALRLYGRLLGAGRQPSRLTARRYLALLATRFAERPRFVEPELLIRPRLGNASPMDFTNVERLDALGYQAARRELAGLTPRAPVGAMARG